MTLDGNLLGQSQNYCKYYSYVLLLMLFFIAIIFNDFVNKNTHCRMTFHIGKPGVCILIKIVLLQYNTWINYVPMYLVASISEADVGAQKVTCT